MEYLNEDLKQLFKDSDPYLVLANMKGKIYRQVKARKTFQFEYNGKRYFAKVHTGVGWLEIIKNILQLKIPILGAKNEWRAIEALHKLSLATMKIVAYGERGFNPAKKQSFIITEELQNTISLEDYCLDWKVNSPNSKDRKLIIDQVATIARTLHDNGICHRDFYLCHFLLHKDSSSFPKLSLIDLHRALINENLAQRWIVKDIAGLYYSSMEIGLSRRDLLRFALKYGKKTTKLSLRQNRPLWDQVDRRAKTMYRKLGPAR